jgi:hypothetical protein
MPLVKFFMVYCGCGLIVYGCGYLLGFFLGHLFGF